jgi:hypothetical protein
MKGESIRLETKISAVAIKDPPPTGALALDERGSTAPERRSDMPLIAWIVTLIMMPKSRSMRASAVVASGTVD